MFRFRIPVPAVQTTVSGSALESGHTCQHISPLRTFATKKVLSSNLEGLPGWNKTCVYHITVFIQCIHYIWIKVQLVGSNHSANIDYHEDKGDQI